MPNQRIIAGGLTRITRGGLLGMMFAVTVALPSVATADDLTTTYVGGNSQNGNIFDVVALQDVVIDSFDGNISGSNTIEIWYKEGTCVGYQSNAGAWTLLGSTSASGTSGTPTPFNIVIDVEMLAGETFGFYVTTTSGSMIYTNGGSVGAVSASDSNIQILEGYGKSYPFGSTFTVA